MNRFRNVKENLWFNQIPFISENTAYLYPKNKEIDTRKFRCYIYELGS